MSNVFVIPGTTTERAPVIEVIPAPETPMVEEFIEITPDMRVGVEEYVAIHEASSRDTERARAIAWSVLKHSWFLPAGRHSLPRSKRSS